MKKKESRTVRLPVYCEHDWTSDSVGKVDVCRRCYGTRDYFSHEEPKVQIGWVEVPK